MNKNIRDLVLNAINTDDSFNNINSKNIVNLYTTASTNEKEVIDQIFINLCGYSLNTMITNSVVISTDKFFLNSKPDDFQGTVREENV
jgi:hypothetical protein